MSREEEEEEFAKFIGLPMEKGPMGVAGKYLYQWDGYWYQSGFLKAAIAAQSNFTARDDDVILTSSPKTGTTWLKALIPSIIMARNIDGNDQDDPLLTRHPNQLIPSVELVDVFCPKVNPKQVYDEMASPRLFRSHLPYSKLPTSVENCRCKLVYITRDPKDVFVSMYHFVSKLVAAWGGGSLNINQLFEDFCRGVHGFGPLHDHVLEYWNESLNQPEKILFLRYEEMKKDPKGQVRRNLIRFFGDVAWKGLRIWRLTRMGWTLCLVFPKMLILGLVLLGTGKTTSQRRCKIVSIRLPVKNSGGLVYYGAPTNPDCVSVCVSWLLAL